MSRLTLPVAVTTRRDLELGSGVAPWQPPLAKSTLTQTLNF